jgi:hypothetical protein
MGASFMPIIPRASTTVNTEKQNADTATAFDETLAVTAVASDLVLVPALKKGRTISFVNEGPGDIAIKFDGTATVTDILILEGEAYSEANLEVATKVSFINVTAAQLPRVRGVLWSGNPSA